MAQNVQQMLILRMLLKYTVYCFVTNQVGVVITGKEDKVQSVTIKLAVDKQGL
jgi:hypothetical protein